MQIRVSGGYGISFRIQNCLSDRTGDRTGWRMDLKPNYNVKPSDPFYINIYSNIKNGPSQIWQCCNVRPLSENTDTFHYRNMPFCDSPFWDFLSIYILCKSASEYNNRDFLHLLPVIPSLYNHLLYCQNCSFYV